VSTPSTIYLLSFTHALTDVATDDPMLFGSMESAQRYLNVQTGFTQTAPDWWELEEDGETSIATVTPLTVHP
jgi:hypothetical protein